MIISCSPDSCQSQILFGSCRWMTSASNEQFPSLQLVDCSVERLWTLVPVPAVTVRPLLSEELSPHPLHVAIRGDVWLKSRGQWEKQAVTVITFECHMYWVYFTSPEAVKQRRVTGSSHMCQTCSTVCLTRDNMDVIVGYYSEQKEHSLKVTFAHYCLKVCVWRLLTFTPVVGLHTGQKVSPRKQHKPKKANVKLVPVQNWIKQTFNLKTPMTHHRTKMSQKYM